MSNTLQIKVSIDIANVVSILTLRYIDMFRDDQMFSVFFTIYTYKAVEARWPHR